MKVCRTYVFNVYNLIQVPGYLNPTRQIIKQEFVAAEDETKAKETAKMLFLYGNPNRELEYIGLQS